MRTGTIERDTQHKHQPWVILSQKLNESPALHASPRHVGTARLDAKRDWPDNGLIAVMKANVVIERAME